MIRKIRQARGWLRERLANAERVIRPRLAVGALAAVRWFKALSRRQIMIGSAAVVLGVAVALGCYLAQDDQRQLPDTRARHYRDVDACLLTGKNGITAGTTAAQVWQGMQDASLRTHVRVSYQPVTGEQSAANARPYLNSLVQRACDVVLASGKPAVQAAEQAVPQQRKVRFILVDGAARARNAIVVTSGDGLRAKVAEAVEREFGARG